MDSLFVNLRKYRTNSLKNFVTEAFAWLLRRNTELNNYFVEKLPRNWLILKSHSRCPIKVPVGLRRKNTTDFPPRWKLNGRAWHLFLSIKSGQHRTAINCKNIVIWTPFELIDGCLLIVIRGIHGTKKMIWHSCAWLVSGAKIEKPVKSGTSGS